MLLVDEVLAVGDAEFQRRCLGTMEQIGRSGRAVVFVAPRPRRGHAGCAPPALWLSTSSVRAVGPTAQIVDAYLLDATPDAGARVFVDDPALPVALTSLRVRGATGCRDRPGA